MSNSWEDAPFYVKATVKLMLLALVILFMVAARELLIPFTVSMLLAFLLLPVSRTLTRWRVPRVVAILLSILLAIAVFGGLLYFLYMQVESFADDWPMLKTKVIEKWDSIQQWIFHKFNISRHEQSRWLDEKLQEKAKSGDVMALGFFSATGSFIANLVLIPVYIFFLTLYKDKIKEFVLIITKNQDSDETLGILKKISSVSQNYVKGIMLDVMILSVLNSTGFLILDLDHAILFGVLASILNIIPYIGVLIGSILPVAMALLTKDEFSYALAVAGVTVVVQFLDNNFITPYVVGSSVSINPLTAVIALMVGALIWGLPGMILCMPITGMIKVVCDNVKPLQPYGFILGEEVNYNARRQKNSAILKRFGKKK